MSDVMSFAEIHDQFVELLPARTVLSLLHAAQGGIIGAPGRPGARGAHGPGLVDYAWSGLFGNSDQSGLPGTSSPAGMTS